MRQKRDAESEESLGMENALRGAREGEQQAGRKRGNPDISHEEQQSA